MAKRLRHREAGNQERQRPAMKEGTPALHSAQAMEETLSRQVSSLQLDGLPANTRSRALNQLISIGVKTLSDLVKFSEQDLRRVKYFSGEKTLHAFKKELVALGLRLGIRKKSENRKEAGPLEAPSPFVSVKDSLALETNLPKEEVQEALAIGLRLKPLKKAISQAKAELSRIGELVKTISEVLDALAGNNKD